MTITLRPADISDGPRVLEWRNTQDARAMSLTCTRISEAEHMVWLNAVLADHARLLQIIELDEAPVGTIRLDNRSDTVDISIVLSPGSRGRGIGSAALALAIADCPYEQPTFTAIIKPENVASLALFRQAGFISTGDPLTYIKPR